MVVSINDLIGAISGHDLVVLVVAVVVTVVVTIGILIFIALR